MQHKEIDVWNPRRVTSTSVYAFARTQSLLEGDATNAPPLCHPKQVTTNSEHEVRCQVTLSRVKGAGGYYKHTDKVGAPAYQCFKKLHTSFTSWHEHSHGFNKSAANINSFGVNCSGKFHLGGKKLRLNLLCIKDVKGKAKSTP